jgi:hypothetical protein
MPTDVATEAVSSTPSPNFEPSTYSADEHSTWMATGKLPEAPSLAASTPATKTAGAAQADKPATESATVSQQQEPVKGKGAEARKAELRAEIQSLLKERDSLKAKPDAIAAPSPAPKETRSEKPVKPVFGDKDGETWEQFDKRNDEYLEKLVQHSLAEDRRAREKERADAETTAANKRIEDGWNERVAAAKSKPGREDFAEVAFSKETPISPVMDGFILDSDVGPEILYYLGSHVEEAKAIAAATPYKAARALTVIEQSLNAPATSPAKPAPAVIPTTRAARPATDLRATNSAPADEVRAAVEANDYTRFAELQNAKSIARRKQG